MIIKICGIVLICLISTILLKNHKSNLSSLVTSLCIIIVAVTVIIGISDKISVIQKFAAETAFGEYILIMVKALGIAYISIITSEICVSSGETLLSNVIESAAKVEIILLCTPMITRVFEITKGLI